MFTVAFFFFCVSGGWGVVCFLLSVWNINCCVLIPAYLHYDELQNQFCRMDWLDLSLISEWAVLGLHFWINWLEREREMDYLHLSNDSNMWLITGWGQHRCVSYQVLENSIDFGFILVSKFKRWGIWADCGQLLVTEVA